MWVQPLSISQFSLDLVLEKHVALNKWSSSSSWSTTFIAMFLIPILAYNSFMSHLIHIVHLAFGLLQHLNDGWPFFPNVGKVGKIFFEFHSFLLHSLMLSLLQFYQNPFWIFPHCWLAAKAPSVLVSSLISLLCACAFNALINSDKDIFEKSLVLRGNYGCLIFWVTEFRSHKS